VSNVIIGIIGVILFIGLALAGASFLGGTLTDGRTQSDVAQIMTSGQQMAVATRLYRVKTGSQLPNTLNNPATLISADMLKAVPGNPIVPANTPFTVDQTGSLTAQRPGYVLMYLGQGERAYNACIEIEIQAGSTDRLAPGTMQTTIAFLSRATRSKIGCHRNQGFFGGNGGASAGEYLAYFPV
jgi:hypothetical protein